MNHFKFMLQCLHTGAAAVLPHRDLRLMQRRITLPVSSFSSSFSHIFTQTLINSASSHTICYRGLRRDRWGMPVCLILLVQVVIWGNSTPWWSFTRSLDLSCGRERERERERERREHCFVKLRDLYSTHTAQKGPHCTILKAIFKMPLSFFQLHTGHQLFNTIYQLCSGDICLVLLCVVMCV